VFDIGFWEIVLICIIALVVLGPERLPEAIRTLSRLIRRIKNISQAIKDEVENGVQEVERNIEDTHISSTIKDIKKLKDNIKK